MNIKKIAVLNDFNIYYQFLNSKHQFLVLDAYSRIRKKRSNNELEKSLKKL